MTDLMTILFDLVQNTYFGTKRAFMKFRYDFPLGGIRSPQLVPGLFVMRTNLLNKTSRQKESSVLRSFHEFRCDFPSGCTTRMQLVLRATSGKKTCLAAGKSRI